MTVLIQLSDVSLPYLAFDEAVDNVNKLIKYDLNKLGLKIEKIEDEQMGTLAIIIPKDVLLDCVLNSVEEKNIQHHLIEFMSSHSEGDIKRKEEILILLSKYVEGITKDNDLKIVYNRLYDNTDFLYNNLDLRHNIKVKDKRFYNKTLDEREKRLDITYRYTLLVIATKTEDYDSKCITKLKKDVNICG